MLTKLVIRNFKKFESAEIELGKAVVFVGPNNSGKTTALQALALWEIGLRKWNEKRKEEPTPEKRPGVTINRRDLIAVPVPNANLLWRDLHVRFGESREGKQQTKNVRIEITVEGESAKKEWRCGLEFDYANPESFYCRPLRLSDATGHHLMPIPPESERIHIGFLPPMSGLSASEDRLDPGAINRRLGEGRTAEVLRNLCFQIASRESETEPWRLLCKRMTELFGVELDEPEYFPESGEIRMTYRDQTKAKLDLSCAGRGLQQTLLLLSYLTLNPHTVLLIDEPDAHLEILRQRQIYEILATAASENGSQVIMASHSEVVLNEAAGRDVVVAFVGKPHRIDDRAFQVLKSLREIGFEHYYQAERSGWVLYVEGPTDLKILQEFAKILEHPGQRHLALPFVHYVGNIPEAARSHFYGLREAKSDLQGIALFDRIEKQLQTNAQLVEAMWSRREIENYLTDPYVLLAYAENQGLSRSPGELFAASDRKHWRDTMETCIRDLVPPAALRDAAHRFWRETKMSDEFLGPLMESFAEKLGLPNLMRKCDYYVLASYVAKERIDQEVARVLDTIVETASRAMPVGEFP